MNAPALALELEAPRAPEAPRGLPALSFVVHGTPAPAGSKRAFFRGGRAIVVDANKKARPWKDQVAQVAGSFMEGRQLLQGPLELTLRFFVHRPKGHFATSGAVRAAAPRYPAVRPDVLKLARGVEDALSGVVYRDDSQIVVETLTKEYGPERVEIVVRQLAG